jgi:hypothetical protein
MLKALHLVAKIKLCPKKLRGPLSRLRSSLEDYTLLCHVMSETFTAKIQIKTSTFNLYCSFIQGYEVSTRT